MVPGGSLQPPAREALPVEMATLASWLGGNRDVRGWGRESMLPQRVAGGFEGQGEVCQAHGVGVCSGQCQGRAEDMRVGSGGGYRGVQSVIVRPWPGGCVVRVGYEPGSGVSMGLATMFLVGRGGLGGGSQ